MQCAVHTRCQCIPKYAGQHHTTLHVRWILRPMLHTMHEQRLLYTTSTTRTFHMAGAHQPFMRGYNVCRVCTRPQPLTPRLLSIATPPSTHPTPQATLQHALFGRNLSRAALCTYTGQLSHHTPSSAASASLGLVAHLVQGAEGPGDVTAVQLTQELVDVLGAAAGQPHHTM